jgi:hypothetical protein
MTIGWNWCCNAFGYAVSHRDVTVDALSEKTNPQYDGAEGDLSVSWESRSGAEVHLHFSSDDITAIGSSDPIIPVNNGITTALPESRVNRNGAACSERKNSQNEKIPLSFHF